MIKIILVLLLNLDVLYCDIKKYSHINDTYFPLNLPSKGSCTIGGNIATNAGGSNVLKYGMTRDLVLGLEIVLPDGKILNTLKGNKKR